MTRVGCSFNGIIFNKESSFVIFYVLQKNILTEKYDELQQAF